MSHLTRADTAALESTDKEGRFELKNCVPNKTISMHVRGGRATGEMRLDGDQVRYHAEDIEQPSWRYEYAFDDDGNLCLTVVE